MNTNKRAKKAQKVLSGPLLAHLRHHMQHYQDGKGVDELEDTVFGCVHFAASHGYGDLVTQLVKLRYGYNWGELGFDDELVKNDDYTHETPLIEAIPNGHFEIVTTLIRAGVNVNMRLCGESALFLAGLHRHSEIFAALIQAGAIIEEIDHIKFLAECNNPCFELLVLSQQPLRRILEPDSEQDLLIWVLKKIRYHMIENEQVSEIYVGFLQMTIQAGYDVNFMNININKDESNVDQHMSPLMIAVSSGHIRAVQYVIQGGAHVNYWTKDHGTAMDEIITSVKNGCYSVEKAWSMIELLREAGASFDYGERGSFLEYLSNNLHYSDIFAIFERLLNRFPISSLKK